MFDDVTDNENDASSNPNADEHLPTAGEYRTAHVSDDSTLTDVDDIEDFENPNDINEILSKSDDVKSGALDSDGPVKPLVTGDKSY